MVVQEQDYKTASENAKFAKTVLKAFLADTCAEQHVKVNLDLEYSAHYFWISLDLMFKILNFGLFIDKLFLTEVNE